LLNVAGNGVERDEFDGYVRRHEADLYAHTALLERTALTALKIRETMEGRLNALERWQQRITGVLLFLAFVIGGGGAGVVIELVRK
jgi:hypothetical protein